MTTDERLNRLERRLQVVEGLVRQMLAGQRPAMAADLEPVAEPLEASAPVAVPPGGGPPVAPPPRPSPPPPPPLARPSTTATRPRVARVDSEQWFGQRGLLAVGVVFLILAAGYLLKLSFDRGWISPAARCTLGGIAGIVVGAVGWRLHSRLRTYGAALIGTGAAIIYLSVWAATRLYAFLPPTSGIAALALISLSLAAIAWAINVESLGATAALGAFFAPLVVGFDAPNSNTLLLYLGVIGLALGWVAARKRWRTAMLVVALSFFGLVTTGAAEHANPWWVLGYAILGGSSGLYVGLSLGWWETRILAFSGGWGLLGMSAGDLAVPEATLAGALLLAAPVWWRAIQSATIWPGAPAGDADEKPASLGESLYFYLTPLLLAAAVHHLSPTRFDRDPGLVPLIIAIPYLVAGYTAPRRAFALVGTTALGIAALAQWPGVESVWALLALALLWTATDRLLDREDGRWYGLLALGGGLYHLLSVDAAHRPQESPAFQDPWALTLWATIAVLAVLASRGFPGTAEEQPERRTLTPLLWTAAGILLLFGVTGELHRYFRMRGSPGADLAGGLAVSAWWMVFAAGLVILGFRRGVKPVRVAGLLVSGMAVLKVVLFDLSTLDALYRVASVLILGVISLALAYLYHRKGKAGELSNAGQ